MNGRRQSLLQWGFALCVGLLLLTHASAANPGPFGRQAPPLPPFLPDWHIGPLVILPGLVLAGWLAARRRQPQTGWTWGSLLLTGPMLAFTVIALTHMTTMTQWATAVPLLIYWLIFLFRLNTPAHPALLWVLLGVIVMQSAVGMLQFVRQESVGLVWLGELALDTGEIGTSVVLHDGVNWLRAYGINSHPNQLGLLLAALLLMVWPAMRSAHPPLRWATMLAVGIGLGGLVVSLSRSAWLALGAGLLVYGWCWRQQRGRRPYRRRPFRPARFLPAIFLFVGLLIFTFQYGDAIAGRFTNLDNPLESRSLQERPRDMRLAGELIRQRPLSGVGLNQYLPAAQTRNPEAAVVHNVTLLVGAELGVAALGAWLFFLLLPFRQWRDGITPNRAAATAVWTAMILISLVQPEPHLFLVKGAALWGSAASLWEKGLVESVEGAGQ